MALRNLIKGQDKEYLDVQVNQIEIDEPGTIFNAPIIKYKEASITYDLLAGTATLSDQNMRIVQINDQIFMKLNMSTAIVVAGGSDITFLRIPAGTIPAEFLPTVLTTDLFLGFISLFSVGISYSVGSAFFNFTTNEVEIYRNNTRGAWQSGNSIDYTPGCQLVYNLNVS